MRCWATSTPRGRPASAASAVASPPTPPAATSRARRSSSCSAPGPCHACRQNRTNTPTRLSTPPELWLAPGGQSEVRPPRIHYSVCVLLCATEGALVLETMHSRPHATHYCPRDGARARARAPCPHLVALTQPPPPPPSPPPPPPRNEGEWPGHGQASQGPLPSLRFAN